MNVLNAVTKWISRTNGVSKPTPIRCAKCKRWDLKERITNLKTNHPELGALADRMQTMNVTEVTKEFTSRRNTRTCLLIQRYTKVLLECGSGVVAIHPYFNKLSLL
jgi:hypothetical protein